MPKIHAKAKWEHGSGDLIAFDRNPDHWYLRCLVPGTRRYISERIQDASSLEDAQQGAASCYARLVQPKLVVNNDNTASQFKFEVVTSKSAKHNSRLISQCVTEFLKDQYGRYRTGEITLGTYEDKERFLTLYMLPYLKDQGVTHTREIKATTFKRYNVWRSRTSKSKLTRNVELGNFATFFTHYLVPERLIDPDLMVMKNFFPYQAVKEEDLLANPAINADDWRLFTDQLHRWEKASKWCSNYRVSYFRNCFWSFCLVMKNTGIRPAELRRLRWKMVEWEKEKTPDDKVRWIGHINMPANLPTKNRKAREVPTAGNGGTRLMEWMKFQIQYCKDHGHRLPTPDDLIFGMPELDWECHSYKMYHDAWVKTREAIEHKLKGHKFSDKPYTIYSMRSTFIEDALINKTDVWLISRWAGHDIKMLMKHYERMDVRKRSSELTDIEYGKKKEIRSITTMDDVLAKL